MNVPTERYAKRIEPYVKLGALSRDLILAVFGALYVLGSYAFAIHAARLNLGGANPPTASIIVFGSYLFLAAVPLTLLSIVSRQFYKQEISNETFTKFAHVIWVGIAVVPFVLAWITNMHFWPATTLLASSTLMSLLLQRAVRMSENKLILRGLMVAYILLIGISFVLTVILLPPIIAALPQEPGGLRTKCARLDVDLAALSNETKRLMGVENMNAGVASTKDLKVLFTTSDFMVIRTSNENLHLSRGVIRAIRWCSLDEWPALTTGMG